MSAVMGCLLVFAALTERELFNCTAILREARRSLQTPKGSASNTPAVDGGDSGETSFQLLITMSSPCGGGLDSVSLSPSAGGNKGQNCPFSLIQAVWVALWVAARTAIANSACGPVAGQRQGEMDQFGAAPRAGLVADAVQV
jgi:hypothetical protein